MVQEREKERSALGRLICCAALGVALLVAHGARANDGAVDGLRLGDTPATALKWFSGHYAQCALQRSAYHALPGEATGPLATVAVNEGTMTVCHGTPESSDSVDIVVVHFAHPDVAADRPVFEILRERQYPDPTLHAQKHVRYPLDKVLSDLRKQYGKPSDERREHVHSSDPSSSPGRSGGDPQGETIRLLWAPKGKLPAGSGHGQGGAHSHGHIECDCGDRYVIAEIEAARSRQTRPANRAYVTRVSVFAVNEDVRRRQVTWNRQWLK